MLLLRVLRPLSVNTAVAIVAIALVACSRAPSRSDSAAAPPPRDAATGTTITGTVVIDGPAPVSDRIRFDADPQCASLATGEDTRAEDVVVGAGNALRNVFVYVKEGLPTESYPVSSTPVVLDQQKCRYVPRVLGIQVGQPLTIRNSDPLLHTVRGETTVNERFNIGTPVQGIEVTRTFRAPEVMVPITCDMHPWMHAYVGVLEHPFFDVTDASGRFSITGLAPGSYVIAIWHERLGTQSREVNVSVGQPLSVTFTYAVH